MRDRWDSKRRMLADLDMALHGETTDILLDKPRDAWEHLLEEVRTLLDDKADVLEDRPLYKPRLAAFLNEPSPFVTMPKP